MTSERPTQSYAEIMESRMAQYVDLWESARTKLSQGTYHADDFVDDWFRWIGLIARDTTAGATLLLGGRSGPPPDDRGRESSGS